MEKLSKPFLSAGFRHFDRGERPVAEVWLAERPAAAPAATRPAGTG